jgi:hypothetical protein
MEFALMARHGPRRRTIHEFDGAKLNIYQQDRGSGGKFVDGPPSRTMTMEIKRQPIGPYAIAL